MRAALQDVGYRLDAEALVQDGERIYLLLRGIPADDATARYDEEALWLGPCLLHSDDPLVTRYYRKRLNLLRHSVAAQASSARLTPARIAREQAEIAYLERALAIR